MRSLSARIFVAFYSILMLVDHVAAQELPKKSLVFFWADDVGIAGQDDWRGLGTGFLISNDGWILTAKHVVDAVVPGERIVVTVSSKSGRDLPVDDGDIVCDTASQDICAVRVPGNALPADVTGFFALGCYRLDIRAELTALGFVGGDDPDFGSLETDGKVTGDMAANQLVPTNLALNPTMSGGPVIHRGNVVALIKGADSQTGNIGFVTPLWRATHVLQRIGASCSTSAVCDQSLSWDEYKRCNP